MPSFKPDLKITVQVDSESFSICGLLLPDNRYLIKRGRLISKKMPRASLTEIFDTARKWAVKERMNRNGIAPMLSKDEKIKRLEERAEALCKKWGVSVFGRSEYKRICTQLNNLKNN